MNKQETCHDVGREYAFYTFSKKPADTTVYVSYDESIKKRNDEPMTEMDKRLLEIRKEEDKRIKEKLTKGAKTMQHKCIERKNKLAHLIRTNQVNTVEEASIYLDVSKATVRKYLKELNLEIKKS